MADSDNTLIQIIIGLCDISECAEGEGGREEEIKFLKNSKGFTTSLSKRADSIIL
jgi:hypothetical protein